MPTLSCLRDFALYSFEISRSEVGIATLKSQVQRNLSIPLESWYIFPSLTEKLVSAY